MKPTTKLLLAAIVLLLIIYGMFAFVLSEVNPFVWHIACRFGIVAIWAIFLPLLAAYFYEKNTN